MLKVTTAKEIKGKISVPPSQDLFFLSAITALAAGSTVLVSPAPSCARIDAWIEALKGHASITLQETSYCIEPLCSSAPLPLRFSYEDIPYREFSVFLLLGRYGSMIVDSLPMKRFDEWRGLIERAGCRLLEETDSAARRLVLEDSNKFHIPDCSLDIDDFHAFCGLALGLRQSFECTVDSPVVSQLRHMLPGFGFECRVQNRNLAKNEDPLLRRMRFLKTGKKSEGPQQFGVFIDFSKQPAKRVELTLPGDDLFAALIILAKCLVTRGSLLVENVSLEAWNTSLLQLVKHMGAAVGAQETHQCSFGSVGSVVVQKINPFGRKVDCRPRYQFATQVPAMLVMSAFAQGQSIFRHLEHLRSDVPDGIERLNSCISALGARFGEMPDGIVIEGAKQFDGFDLGTPLPAPIAGAFIVAGLKCRGATTIADEYIIRQWPDFKEMLDSIIEFKE